MAKKKEKVDLKMLGLDSPSKLVETVAQELVAENIRPILERQVRVRLDKVIKSEVKRVLTDELMREKVGPLIIKEFDEWVKSRDFSQDTEWIHDLLYSTVHEWGKGLELSFSHNPELQKAKAKKRRKR